MKKQQNNSARALALFKSLLLVALLSIAAVLLAASFNAALATGPDSDGDGIPDSQDNCPTIINPSRKTPMAMGLVMLVTTASPLQIPVRRMSMAMGSVMHVTTARPYKIPVRRTAIAMVLATRVNRRPSRSRTQTTAVRAHCARHSRTPMMATRSTSSIRHRHNHADQRRNCRENSVTIAARGERAIGERPPTSRVFNIAQAKQSRSLA